MAREKLQRKLNFKPLVQEFLPKGGHFHGVSTLLHEEIEAIYLMDVLNLYQEDAAKKMEISRPTFTRILKSARQKLAQGLVLGNKIVLENDKKDCIIAFCANDIDNIQSIDIKQVYIFIYRLENEKITFLKRVPNPLVNPKVKPAIILPQLLLENNVNKFISDKIGEGLKNTLHSKGIAFIKKDSIDLAQLDQY